MSALRTEFATNRIKYLGIGIFTVRHQIVFVFTWVSMGNYENISEEGKAWNQSSVMPSLRFTATILIVLMMWIFRRKLGGYLEITENSIIFSTKNFRVK